MSRLSMRERFAITVRGFGMLKRYCPGLVRDKAVYELISSLQPFVSVWFSARILDEIMVEKRIEALAVLVCGIVLINFLCAACKGLLKRVGDEKEALMWCWFGRIFSDKQMSLDFDDLENAKIQHQRQEAEENLYMFGNGLAQLVWGTAVLVRVGVNLTAALFLAGPLFVSRSENAAVDNPLWAAVVVLCILAGGICNSRATVKENEIFMRWCKGTVWFNRTFGFFGRELYMNPERAKDVRIYDQSVLAERELDKLIRQGQENQGDNFWMALFPGAASVVIGLANGVCYLFVAVKAFFGAFGVGSIVQYVAALSRLGEGVQEFMYLLSDNQVYCQHLQKLFAYLDLPNRRYQGSLTVEKRDDNEYDIEFRDVSFRYPGTDRDALSHVNLKFRIGEKLAVVRRNGSGKTTLIKLLCRLYDPTQGEILLNGVEISKYDYDEYIALFSVVFQDFKLFSFSLGQNVAAGVTYDKERAKECLIKAGLGERLEEMPEGLDTCLYRDFGENGVEISGGEAQKAALARALYKDAPFVILDEPTAALDPVAEYEVYSRFNEIAGDRTAVYISHRLSSCRFCDTVVVFDKGRLVQKGGHDELVLAKDGMYYQLWHAQAQYYT